MKKFTDARIYRRHDGLSEILVDRGVIRQIGERLPEANEQIDLRGHLVVPPYVDPGGGVEGRSVRPHPHRRDGCRGGRLPRGAT